MQIDAHNIYYVKLFRIEIYTTFNLITNYKRFRIALQALFLACFTKLYETFLPSRIVILRIDIDRFFRGMVTYIFIKPDIVSEIVLHLVHIINIMCIKMGDFLWTGLLWEMTVSQWNWNWPRTADWRGNCGIAIQQNTWSLPTSVRWPSIWNERPGDTGIQTGTGSHITGPGAETGQSHGRMRMFIRPKNAEPGIRRRTEPEGGFRYGI